MIKHSIRSKNGDMIEVDLSPIRAIKAFCIECMGFEQHEVKSCTAPTCPLFPFRLGKNARTLSTEHKEKLSILAKSRMKNKR
jgi:hypothetical protein